jgi:pyruvyl transferase EpsO
MSDVSAPARIAAVLRERLDAAIPAGARVALLDYPNHENVGDSAIWLGEMTYLAERGCEVVYHCDLRSYDARRLRRETDVDVVLLHGGGNLGDVWLPHQRFRERVLADVPDRRVVQLPQTIHFGDDAQLEIAKRAFAGHSQFTLMARDARSHAFAERHFACKSVLCPDSAFALGVHERSWPAQVPILWLGRTDHEAAPGARDVAATDGEVRHVDWIGRANGHPLDVAARAGGQLLAHALARVAAPPAAAERALWGDWEWLARRRVAAGEALLARGSVVVTDRLHAHILCLLSGLPHVALDNSYGKLSSYAETWGTLGAQARWADAPAQALALARELRAAQGVA